MKILYIFNALANKAGTERILTDKITYLAATPKYEVSIVTYEQGDHPLAFPLPDNVKWVDIRTCFYRLYRYNIILRTLLYQVMRLTFKHRLTRLVKEFAPDIIICTTYAFSELDIIAGLPGKKILESHVAKNTVEKKFKAPPKSVQYYLANQKDKRILKRIQKFDAIITLTENDKKEWKDFRNVQIIPNLLTFYPETILQDKRYKRVISAGRLQWQKGYDLLIESWREVHNRFPDWHLAIFGDGPDRGLLQTMIEQYGLSEVVHLYMPTDTIYAEYMKSDFYVMSSRWEGFGLVLIEAMSCGIPCISFDCPHGPSDIIDNGNDGFLVENGNISLLAEKINYLIDHENIRTEMGKQARKNVKRFKIENIAGQWEALFNQLSVS
ncbi:glycosyltransferase family 4 protein [Bacteroides thetaiotaomicron]|uniref:glycosyltransferase family 4 protein n=1 Tax=Bacteroides thetaiotaomicron TaxID=818 RepID=UPI0018A13E78|nr:glycosyltransferase family 4 protein [Bacteroides thetaiotaomicron]MDC2232031.1 glycosyltransferase family 4 protein [Bacteroides thetaiotaomicron]